MLALSLVLIAACSPPSHGPMGPDLDGDGFAATMDCDDGDATVNAAQGNCPGDTGAGSTDGGTADGGSATATIPLVGVDELQAGDLQLVELMMVQAVLDDDAEYTITQGQWLELVNNTRQVIDLQALRIEVSRTSELGDGFMELDADDPLLLAPGGVFVHAASADAEVNGRVFPDHAGDWATLEGVTQVRLLAGETELDQVQVDPGAVSTQPGVAWALDGALLAELPLGDPDNADLGTAWCPSDQPYGQSWYDTSDSYGTPGRLNPECPVEDKGGTDTGDGDTGTSDTGGSSGDGGGQ